MNNYPYPKRPLTPEETGLDRNLMIGLVLKALSHGGVLTPGQVAGEIKLSKSVVTTLVDEMVVLQLIESRGLEAQDVKSQIRYSLTMKGERNAAEAMLKSQYFGAAPVPLADFTKQVGIQSIKNESINADELRGCLSHLVLPEAIMDQIGPAVNSARSILLYGAPGNGKTAIAEALGEAFEDRIYLPYAIAVGNQVIRFFDEAIHEVVGDAEQSDELKDLDPRWMKCKRPVVLTGGELTLRMLDLEFDPQARFHEAPMQVKALGGVFVIDDFGRQQTTPREILNRWIFPMEKGHDILCLNTGQKISIPFDQLVIFSTNLVPEELSDGAALRRIYYKIFVPSPTRDDYLEIFRRACRNKGVEFREDVLENFYEDIYVKRNLVPSGAHPIFLVSHIISACAYQQRDVKMTRDLLDLAWKNVVASAAPLVGSEA